MIDCQATCASNKNALCVSVQNARSRLDSIEEQLTNLGALKSTDRILRKINHYVTGHSSAYNERAPRMRNMRIFPTKHAFPCRRNNGLL